MINCSFQLKELLPYFYLARINWLTFLVMYTYFFSFTFFYAELARVNGLVILGIDGLVVMKLIFGIKVLGTRTRTRRESKVFLSHTHIGTHKYQCETNHQFALEY